MYPLPSQLDGLGEHRELPQQSPGLCADSKRVLVYLELERTRLLAAFLTFCSTFSNGSGLP